MKYYAAYGSNLNARKMKRRCSGAKPVGKAVLEGYHLVYKGEHAHSYLTIEPFDAASLPMAQPACGYELPELCIDGKVRLGIWEISDKNEESLDLYEEYPEIYTKTTISLEMENRSGEKEQIEALIYMMHDEQPYALPNRFYEEECSEGFNDFGFDEAVLSNAKAYTAHKVLAKFSENEELPADYLELLTF